MSLVLSSRTIVITSILIALAAITVSANWGSGFGFSLFTANEPAIASENAAEPAAPIIEIAAPPATNLLPPPLNAVTSFDIGMVARHVGGVVPLTSNEQLVAADATS